MKYILLILALMFSAPVFAQEQQTASQALNAEIAKMDDAQKAEALSAIRASQSTTAAKAREWVEIGNALGEGMAATAEKMGVVANDFAKSPLGKLAMVLIIWNYMGESLVLLGTGLGLVFIGGGLWIYMSRKLFGEYNEKGKFIKYDTNLISRHEGLCGVMIVSAIILFAGSILTLVNAV